MLNPIRRRLSKLSSKAVRAYVKRRYIDKLFAAVPSDAVIREIGGGFNPRYVKGSAYPNVYHLDQGTTDVLRAKYSADPNVADRVGRIQPIDFVFAGEPIEHLVPAHLRFDLVYGSHTLEHQVDLIGHLQSVEKLLRPGGRVIHIVPDLRTCFDALRYPSVTSDALQAHLHPAPTHRGKQVFDFKSRTLKCNLGRVMRDADFDGVPPLGNLQRAWALMQAAETPDHREMDTHAWTFTPESFRLLMLELRLLGLTGLAPTWVSPTYGNQFCAVLECSTEAMGDQPKATLDALERERLNLAIGLRLRG